ncbi:MAG TPA: LamG-like jellyroll fold domain-containing protein [Polyangiaceae bacterium]|nr:LamG-like jellyroll fold domain-containing protein [Polyangiaceae bacterium]
MKHVISSGAKRIERPRAFCRRTAGRSIGALAAMAILCDCSFLFDLGRLDDGSTSDAGRDATASDAMLAALVATEAGAGRRLDDATVDVVEAPDERPASEAGLDSGPLAAPATGSSAPPAPDAASEAGSPVATTEGAPGPGAPDATSEASDAASEGLDAEGGAFDVAPQGAPDAVPDAPQDGVTLLQGLVAFYPFDEDSGTTSKDYAGNHLATMVGATFGPGVQRNAAYMNGIGQYISLPNGIVSSITSFSIAAWVYVNVPASHDRVFDFGTGTTQYMYLTATPVLRSFGITTTGLAGEQNIDGPPLSSSQWHHVAVVNDGGTATQYVDGLPVGSNSNMTLTPTSIGTTTQTWLGRSQYAADPYLNGRIDNFRIYGRVVSMAEIAQLVARKL